jgi:sec-independent protein translocase protein TatA
MSILNFNVLALGMPMGSEWLVIGLLGLLIFGKRLPEVGKAVGKTLKQFREGMNGMKEEIADAVDAPTVRALLTEPDSAPAARPALKFDPYTGKPLEEAV